MNDPYSQGRRNEALRSADGGEPQPWEVAEYQRGQSQFNSELYAPSDAQLARQAQAMENLRESGTEYGKVLFEAPFQTVFFSLVVAPLVVGLIVAVVLGILKVPWAGTAGLAAGAIAFGFFAISLSAIVLILIAPVAIPLAIVGYFVGDALFRAPLAGALFGVAVAIVLFGTYFVLRRLHVPKNVVLGLDALVIVAMLGGAYVLAPSTVGPAIEATLTVPRFVSTAFYDGRPGCGANGEAGDMNAGTVIVVKDGAGKQIGAGTLGEGAFDSFHSATSTSPSGLSRSPTNTCSSSAGTARSLCRARTCWPRTTSSTSPWARSRTNG